jgi:hypothetical protein
MSEAELPPYYDVCIGGYPYPEPGDPCPYCPHSPDDCLSPDPEDCPHWHNAPDIKFLVTAEMAEAADLLGADGTELLGHAVRSALEDQK